MHAQETTIRLSLYGSEGSRTTLRAWTNITQVLEALGMDAVPVEFVDVLHHPERTFDDGVLVTPTLIVLSEDKRHVLVGTVEDTSILREILAVQVMEQ